MVMSRAAVLFDERGSEEVPGKKAQLEELQQKLNEVDKTNVVEEIFFFGACC